MKDFYNRNRLVINNILFMAALVAFVYIFIKYLFPYVSPFVIGYIISLALNPLADFLDKKYKMHRGVTAFILVVLFILIIVSLGTLLVSKIAVEIKAFAANIPLFSEDIKAFINNIRNFFNDLLIFVPDDLRSFIDAAFIELMAAVTNLLGSMVKTGSMNVVYSLPNFLLNTVLSFISAFFFIKDKYIINRLFETKRVSQIGERLTIVRTGFGTALKGYVKAQLTIMSVISAICILGLTIMGNPYSLIIGLFIGIIDALPVFGLGAVLWPWILYSFLTHKNGQAMALCIIYAVGFLTRQMLEPKVLSQQIGVHPLITLISIYTGLKLFGVVGILLGPVIVVTMRIMLRQTQELADKEAS